MLINGRRSGMANMSKFPTKNIERIEIIRGPAAVQYGSSAIGGVVNIITKRGSEDTEASFNMGAGSWGRYDLGAEFSSAKGPIDFSLGLAHRSMNDNYKGGNGEEVKGGYIDFMRNVSANLGYNFNDHNRLGLIINASDNKFGQPARNAQTKADPFETRDKNSSFDLIYDGSLESEFLRWQLRYFKGSDKYEEYQTDKRSTRIEYYKTDLQGFQGQFTFNLDQINTAITAGQDWVEYDVEQRAVPNNFKSDDTAGFLMARTGFFDDRLFLNGGFRYDSFTNKAANGKNTYHKTTPTFGAALLLTENLKLRANWTRGYRVPSVWESISDTSPTPARPTTSFPTPT
jgi:vitamin B12 transporter